MTPFEAYKEYLSLKAHFNTPAYDYLKMHGEVRASVDSFNKRRDKIFFIRLSKQKDLKNLLIANFVSKPNSWVRDFVRGDEAKKILKEWQRRQESLSYIFKQELSELNRDFDSNLKVTDGDHPVLLKKYLAGKISIETICLILEITDANKHWDKELQDDVVWKDIRVKILKYTPFITIEREKIKKILLDSFK